MLKLLISVAEVIHRGLLTLVSKTVLLPITARLQRRGSQDGLRPVATPVVRSSGFRKVAGSNRRLSCDRYGVGNHAYQKRLRVFLIQPRRESLCFHRLAGETWIASSQGFGLVERLSRTPSPDGQAVAERRLTSSVSRNSERNGSSRLQCQPRFGLIANTAR